MYHYNMPFSTVEKACDFATSEQKINTFAQINFKLEANR